MKHNNFVELINSLPNEERILVDVLRQIILSVSPNYIKEKLSFGVPYFYGNKGIAIIWPASIPRGGIKSGVLLGFWQGNKLADELGLLKKGNNKKIFYKIYHNADDVDDKPILKLMAEAIAFDRSLCK
jgi:hypothetical protein